GKDFSPAVTCPHCGDALRPEDVAARPGPGGRAGRGTRVVARVLQNAARARGQSAGSRETAAASARMSPPLPTFDLRPFAPATARPSANAAAIPRQRQRLVAPGRMYRPARRPRACGHNRGMCLDVLRLRTPER